MPEYIGGEDQSELYISHGYGEIQIDTGSYQDVSDAIPKLSDGSKRVLEMMRGLSDKARRDAQESRLRKGQPPVAPVPPKPNKSASKKPPKENALPAGDSAQMLAAPDLEVSEEDVIFIKSHPLPALPQPSRQAPSHSAFDQLNPLPAKEVVSLVLPPPVNESELDILERLIQRNEPMPGEPHPTHAAPIARQPSVDADPVDLLTGAFTISVVDLRVPTPYIPIEMARSYRSGRPYYGPFGFGWDHRYNVYLRKLNDGGVALWNGELREYQFHAAGAGFEPEAGFAAQLERMPDLSSVFQVRFPGGLVWRFEQPAGWSDVERIPLTTIRDRYGNTVRLSYNSLNRVASVLDPAGRGLYFHYGSCELLEQVTDHTGSRSVHYDHDSEIEHLVRVLLPATAHYPKGLSTTYEYDRYASHPAMQHNILRIYDTEKRLMVENEFAGPDAGWEFNSVVRQRLAGFEYQFEYQQIQYVWPDPENVDVLAARTLVRRPDGSLHSYTFNYRGDLLDYRYRLSRDGSYRVISFQWDHDTEGNVTKTVGPDGLRTYFTYDSANADPCARRNLLRIELASPMPGLIPSRMQFEGQYEARYQLPTRTIDEYGVETRYFYDFDINPIAASGRLVRIELPVVVGADGMPQQSTAFFEHNAQGQLTARVKPEGGRTELAYISGGIHDGFLWKITEAPASAHLVSRFEYDAAGFPKLAEAPGGRTTGFLCNGLGQAEKLVVPEVGGRMPTIHRWFDDSGAIVRLERPSGSSAGEVLSGTSIIDEYERDVVGNVRSVTLAANTNAPRKWIHRIDYAGRPVSTWDPTGMRIDRCFGENGMLLSETVAAGEVEAERTLYAHDRAGRLTRITGPWKDVTRFEYDMWGRVHRITLPNGALRTLEYGTGNQLLEERVEEVTATPSPPRLLQRQTYEYDKRGRLASITLWSFLDDPATSVPLTTRYQYDRDDNVRVILLPRGARYQYDFDHIGRITAVTDPHGNVRQLAYNSSGDLHELTTIEIEDGVAHAITGRHTYNARGHLTRLEEPGSFAEYDYDDRGLLIEQRTARGVKDQWQYDVHGQVIAHLIDPGGLALRSQFEYDLKGRMRRYRDPTGQLTTWVRDALGRHVTVTSPDGTAWEYLTDTKARTSEQRMPSGNRVKLEFAQDENRPAKMSCVAASGHEAVALHEFQYDGMDRLIHAAMGTDVLLRRYDSLGRLREESARGKTVRMEFNDITGSRDLVFPDGRRERTDYNATGQPTRITLVTPGNLGGSPGEVLLEIAYSTAGRPVRVLYGNGVEGHWIHDERGRVIRIEYQKSGVMLDSCRIRYDEDEHRAVVQYLGVPLRNSVHRFDGRERLVEARSGFPLAPLPDAKAPSVQAAEVAAVRIATAGAPGVMYSLDGADARLKATGVNGATANENYVLAGDHRVTGVGSTTVFYNADGHRTLDALYEYQLDALNRVRRVKDRATNTIIAEMKYDALSRVAMGSINSKGFERWFAGHKKIHEISGPGPGEARQYSPHPMWPSSFYVIDAANPAFIHQDEGWSTMCVTNSTGTVLERHRYDFFGTRSVFAADGATPLASFKTEPIWRGMPGLGTTPLFQSQQRLYDPKIGVFMSRDPLLYADSPSPYAFAAHNPVDFADSSGFAKSPLGKEAPSPQLTAPDWTTQTEWAFPKPDRRLHQPITRVDTGNRPLNFVLNKLLLPWGNVGIFFANIPLAAAIGVEDAIEHSQFKQTYEAAQVMLPMGKAMGLAIEAPVALNYLATLISEQKIGSRLTSIALIPMWGFLSTGGGMVNSPRIRSASQAAVRGYESGIVNIGEGRLGFSSYNTAPLISKAVGFRDAEMEAAHILPQAIGEYVPGYSPGRALVTYLPRHAHKAWDRIWIPTWNAAVRNKMPMYAGQVYTMLDDALAMNPHLSQSIRGTISWRLFEEMFIELQLLWDTPILP